MASTISDLQIDFNTTKATNGLRLEDFVEYRISLKIHLYVLPILVSVGIPGNIVSFVVLVFSTFRKSTTSIYLATMAILDTVILILSILWFISFYHPEVKIFRDGTCQFIHLVFYFAIHFNVLVLVAMTVERFIAVVFPLKAPSLISTKKASIVITGIGLFSFALNLHHVFTKGMITSADGSSSCWIVGDEPTKFFVGKIYPWIDSFIYSILPMTSLFVLNIVMIVTMNRAMQSRHTMHGSRSNSSGDVGQRQLTVMLLLVSFAFLVLTGPMGILLLLSRYTWHPETLGELAVSKLTHSVVDNMMYANHAINFVFYCMSGRRFRDEVRKMFCFTCTRKEAAPLHPGTFQNSTEMVTSVSTIL
ncbi:growth hormone secretagogue receptor type 1-like [Gigantopelta aegis]|uniref:growth hormone secretagogue receptor type 1-like n=1 Tax=Gigantopelta aegis TaxID=1735272 RepID=UPI001B88811A|nr:growth hormone secretagogue receptor type 1-like [Gigantopelta aegis]